MSVYDCWTEQREALRRALAAETPGVSDTVYAVRRALAQTEQNALSQQTDDVLRQQTGVLFGMVKSGVSFLETPLSSTVWEAKPQRTERPSRGRSYWQGASAALIAFCGLCCYFRGIVPGWIAALAALLCGGVGWLRWRKAAADQDSQAEIRVALRPDVDRLLAILDGQIRAVDRCVADFDYLNDSLRGGEENGAAVAERVADLLDAIWELEGEEKENLSSAAGRLLSGMDLQALEYNEDNRRFFTTLPSKSETRTLSPAILSAGDFRLLHRGAAAVRTEELEKTPASLK